MCHHVCAGKERNVPLNERSFRRLRFDNPDVCKYDLAGLCPHGLFKNTRSDLGPCEYEYHSDHLDWPVSTKAAEEASSKGLRLLRGGSGT